MGRATVRAQYIVPKKPGIDVFEQDVKLLKIIDIKIDDEIYPRVNYDPETAKRYVEAMTADAEFPPLIVMPDGTLLDGRHRYEAHKLVGTAEIKVIIENPEDPAVRAAELNLSHGKPLTRDEMRELARKWYGTRPVTNIADILGVTRQTVQNWVADLAAEREEAREEIREKALEMRAEGKTQEEVAGELGVPRQTISRWENQECSSVKNLTHEQTEITGKDLEMIHSGGSQDEDEDEDIASGDEPSFYMDPPVHEEKPLEDYGGQEAAEAFRKKHLECSDQVKDFFNKIKKASEVAEQLVDNREKLYRSIAEMKDDGMSFTVLASAAIQACDIYIPRINQARDMLSELLKPGIKGMVSKEKFLVVNGGKQDEG